jgi:hypothetical protein
MCDEHIFNRAMNHYKKIFMIMQFRKTNLLKLLEKRSMDEYKKASYQKWV